MMKNYFLFFAALFFLNGCVSVQITPNKSRKAQDAKFQEPSSPFKKLQIENADSAWQSQKTGNTIAFISECNGNDQSLNSLERESLATMSKAQLLKSQPIDFSGREALESFIEGQVDGINVKLSQIIFKKNGCNFILSYVGRKESFETETNIFDAWKKTVRVP